MRTSVKIMLIKSFETKNTASWLLAGTELILLNILFFVPHGKCYGQINHDDWQPCNQSQTPFHWFLHAIGLLLTGIITYIGRVQLNPWILKSWSNEKIYILTKVVRYASVMKKIIATFRIDPWQWNFLPF